MTEHTADRPPEDRVDAFQLHSAPARGRYARLGRGALDPILRRHAYPRPVALLLGEALALAALVGALFKVKGRLSIQAEGVGPVSLLVADCTLPGDEATPAALRGYARFDDRASALPARSATLRALLGEDARLAVTLDQGPDAPLTQGVVALEGDTLASCAEAYFARSEQTETRIRLAVGEDASPGAPSSWRAGGALLQRFAADQSRASDEDAWETAAILFASLQDAELLDPALPAPDALYRLFHEGGVRFAPGRTLKDDCGCDAGRVAALLARYPAQELAGFVADDGFIHADCRFCARTYRLDPAALAP